MKLYVYHINKDKPNRDINIFINDTNRLLPGWIICPELAPSNELKEKYYEWQWKKQWPKQWETFKKLYKKELTEQPLKKKFLLGIIRRINSGKTIAIGCDCSDEKHCHKQIIAEILGEKGIEVIQGSEIRKLHDKQEKTTETNYEQLRLL